MAAGWVSDEVWARLDPRAGRLTRRGRLALALGALGVAALAVAVWLAASSGLIRPRLSVAPGWSGTFSHADHSFSETVRIDNTGWTDAHLRSVTTSVQGLRVSAVRGLPRTLAAGSSATVTVHYAVSDCSLRWTGPSTFEVHVAQWWGSATVPLDTDDSALSTLAFSACGKR